MRSGFSLEQDDFTECILAFSRNLRETDNVSPDLRNQFFHFLQQNESLPAKSTKELIDAFLASLVSLINLHSGTGMQLEALGHLFKFIKNGK